MSLHTRLRADCITINHIDSPYAPNAFISYWCIMHHCILSWTREHMWCIFFHSASFGINQCQFYNDYFHFNFHAKRFFSFKCSLHPCIYCLLYLVIALESLVDHHHNKITCHTFYDFISRVFQFSPFWILHRYDKT